VENIHKRLSKHATSVMAHKLQRKPKYSRTH